jgi:hypothetical protein
MPAHASAADLLTLHALRLGGMAEPAAVAARFRLDPGTVEELLLDFAAYGWARRSEFAGDGGWNLTDAGRHEGERRLAAELAETGAGEQVARAHATFLPLNTRFQDAVTRWQLRPLPGEPMAPNDHSDPRWDDRVLDELAGLGARLTPVCADLAAALTRFDGYAERYLSALGQVERGLRRWVDGIGIDSCHRVWFELHEDLLATLGIERGDEA